MTEQQSVPGAEEAPEVLDIQTRIAEKIRADSGERMRLTGVAAVEALFTGDDPDVRFEEMMADPRFEDIKWLTSPTGQALFYSDRHMTADQAAAESALESALVSVSEQVRSDSREIALTPMEVAVALLPETLREEPATVLERMAVVPACEDIKQVAGPTGAEYLHSDRYISSSYARILARAEANDPLVTIAETVREESRVYPRVTSLATFEQAVFNIDPQELDGHIERLLSDESYADIKKTVVSNGAVYLFSERHLDPRLAARQAEDAELGDELNP